MAPPFALPQPKNELLTIQKGTATKKKAAPAKAKKPGLPTFAGLLAQDVTRRQEGLARGGDIKERGIEHLLAAREEAGQAFEGLDLGRPARKAPAAVAAAPQEAAIRPDEQEMLAGAETPPAAFAGPGAGEEDKWVKGKLALSSRRIRKEYETEVQEWRMEMRQWQEDMQSRRDPKYRNITLGPPAPRPEMPKSYQDRIAEQEGFLRDLYGREARPGTPSVTKAAAAGTTKPSPARAAPAAAEGAPTMREEVAEAAEKSVETVRDEINQAQSNVATLREEILGELFDTSSQKVEELRQGLDSQLNQTIDQIIASGKERGLSPGDMNAQVAQARLAHGAQLYSLATQAGANYVQQRTTIQSNFANLSNQISQIGISSVTQVAGIGLTGESFAIQNAAKLGEQARQYDESLDKAYQDLALARESAKQANLLSYDRLLMSGMDNLAEWSSRTISFSPIYSQLMNFYSEQVA